MNKTPRIMRSPGPLPLGVLYFALLFGCLIGCKDNSSVTQSSTASQAEVLTGGDDLTQAIDALGRMAEGTTAEATSRTLFYLNQWLGRQELDEAPWKPDRMLENMPRALKTTPGLEKLDSTTFTQLDLGYLQQNLWLHKIASGNARKAPPQELAAWLKDFEAKVGLPEAEQLAAAERLFDWTVRNIQLDELPPPPKGPVATVGAESTDPVLPALQGEVGPGYAHMPVQVLLHGHGDAWERGRVFILLCRQLGVDAVMLGLVDEEVSTTPQGWLPAVMIGKELYLFDTRLGLPVPGLEGQGIATLSQVVSDPAVLEQLNVKGGEEYPVGPTQLKNIVALIDAEPQAFARRMQLLQTALPKAHRLVLSVLPSQLEPTLRKSKGISTVSLWRVPFEAVMYQIGRQQVIAQDQQAALKFYREEAMFNGATPLMRGRDLHLQGRFENVDNLPGARTFYLRARTPDREIDRALSSKLYREMTGLEFSLPKGEKEQAEALESFEYITQRAKHHASYWLGLTYYEDGKYDAAIEWFGKRTLEAVPPSPWIPGARYNMARSYEAQGELAKARDLLLDDDSPQQHGNRVRARMLAERLAQ